MDPKLNRRHVAAPPAAHDRPDRDRCRHRRRRPGRPVPGLRTRPARDQGAHHRLAGLPGGQCIELYPDKPIYDIPAVPVCTGKELTDNLLKQIEPFGATFHLGQEVTTVQKQEEPDGRFLRRHQQGHALPHQDDLHRRWRGLVPAAHAEGRRAGQAYDGKQVFYRVKNPAQFAGKNLVIIGGGDSALDWTLNFVQDGPHKAESVILMHRRDGFRAAPASVAKMKELCEAYEMQFIVGQASGIEERRRQAHRHEGHRRRRRDPRRAAGHAAGVLRPEPEARADRRMGPGHRAQADRRRHREVRDQHRRASSRWATSTPTRARRS